MILKIKSIILSFFGRWLFQILFLLNKVSIKGEKNLIKLIKSNEPIMLCVWHGRLIYPSWYIRFHTKLHIVSSRHPDSEILGRVLKNWGYDLIKGSTNKGGISVIKKMSNVFDDGGMIAVTNDGPKGPAQMAKSGSIGLAIKKNVNIITVTGSASRFWELNSWDKTLIPKPFGKIQLIVSKPLKIIKEPKNSYEEVEILNEFINSHQDAADKITGKIS
tara:strand:+ start:122 stop:775 length:654 start_codon:yes stop_codon:yes gene_type:complete